jgi:hypothetical protein
MTVREKLHQLADTLPEDAVQRLLEFAQEQPISRMNGSTSDLTEKEKQERRNRFLSHAGSIDLGYATGSDNESIDMDLGLEYGGAHADA